MPDYSQLHSDQDVVARQVAEALGGAIGGPRRIGRDPEPQDEKTMPDPTFDQIEALYREHMEKAGQALVALGQYLATPASIKEGPIDTACADAPCEACDAGEASWLVPLNTDLDIWEVTYQLTYVDELDGEGGEFDGGTRKLRIIAPDLTIAVSIGEALLVGLVDQEGECDGKKFRIRIVAADSIGVQLYREHIAVDACCLGVLDLESLNAA
ncbi:MAG: hypothetical protein AAGD32_17570 [Planctomycetota bacterium]